MAIILYLVPLPPWLKSWSVQWLLLSAVSIVLWTSMNMTTLWFRMQKKKIATKSDIKSFLQPYHNCCWNCYRNSYNCSNLIWSKHWRNCSFTFRLDFCYMHPGLGWGKRQFLTNSIHRLRTQNEEISQKCFGWMWQTKLKNAHHLC